VLACGPRASEEVSIDLVETTPVAKKQWRGILFEFGTPSARPYLDDGWSYGETSPDGNTFRWAVQKKASFRFEGIESHKRVAWIECEPFTFPGAPTQALTFVVNGHALPPLQLREGRHRYPIEIPVVEDGVNEVQVQFAYVGTPEREGDRRHLAAAFYRFDLPPEDKPLVAGQPGPFSLVEPEEGSRGVYLPEGGTISYYLTVPKGARLTATVGASKPTSLLTPAGSVLALVIRGEDGSVVEGEAKASDSGGEILRVEKSLDGLEGLRAEISFRAEGDDILVAPQLFASEEEGSPQPSRERPIRDDVNVLMIVLDGATALRMGPYGYSKPTTPNIDRLARESVVFERVFTQAVYTIASIGSLLTGQYPERHQNVTFADRLPETAVTLPGLLGEAGIRTAAFSGNAVVTAAFGLDRGYDDFFDVRQMEGYTGHGDSVLRELLYWLERNQDQRFFAYVHFREPHFPYNPPPPFDAQFGPAKLFPGGISDWHTVEAFNQAAGLGQSVPSDVYERIRALYDGNMAFVDSLVGEILRYLDDTGLHQKTIVVLTADHGEALYEHGYIGHNTQLYEESIRIPLMIRGPDWPSRRISQIVELLDLTPTVLAIFGLEGHPANREMEGRNLLRLLNGETLGRRWAFSRTLWNKPRYSVRGSRYKLIWDSNTDKTELYDLDGDPEEKSNLAEDKGLIRGFLQQELLRWIWGQERLRVGAPAPESSEITEDLRRQLESLGYIRYVEQDKKKE
jgi:arylsulfatase A-like enzyme